MMSDICKLCCLLLISVVTVISFSLQDRCKDKELELLCPWGVVYNDYYRRCECARGTGDRCGGFMNIVGVCAGSLMCIREVGGSQECHGVLLDDFDR